MGRGTKIKGSCHPQILRGHQFHALPASIQSQDVLSVFKNDPFIILQWTSLTCTDIHNYSGLMQPSRSKSKRRFLQSTENGDVLRNQTDFWVYMLQTEQQKIILRAT